MKFSAEIWPSYALYQSKENLCNTVDEHSNCQQLQYRSAIARKLDAEPPLETLIGKRNHN